MIAKERLGQPPFLAKNIDQCDLEVTLLNVLKLYNNVVDEFLAFPPPLVMASRYEKTA